MSPCCGRRTRQPAQVPSLVPAQTATGPHSAGLRLLGRRTPAPSAASYRWCRRQDRMVPAARSGLVPAPDPAPARTRCSWRSGRVVPDQPPGQAPAEARRPARIRCSAGSGRTALASGGRRPARDRTGRCCTGRPHKASDRPLGRTTRPWEPGPGRTAPGQADPGRTAPGRSAPVLVPSRTSPAPAARRRTGPVRSRMALARIPGGRAATLALARRHPALAVATAPHPASWNPASRDPAGRTTAVPRTGRGRPDPGQAARTPAVSVLRWPPTPGRTGTPVAVRSALVPAASRAPGRHTAVPVGPVPVQGSSVPGTPLPAGRATTPAPAPDTRLALDIPVPAALRRNRPRPAPARTRKRAVRGAAVRRTPPGADRAGVPGAAGPDAAGPGEPAAGGGRPGVAADGRRPASRPPAAARAGPPLLSRRLPACQYVAGSRA